jgi:hypothetical protein
MNEGNHIMVKASWMALLAFGTVVSTAALAGDATPAASDVPASPAPRPPSGARFTDLGHVPRWQRLPPAEAVTDSADWPAPIADFDFREASALARVSKLRSLSLLTLAEFGQTRMFFGINDSGLLGLHFSGLPRHADGRYVELVRMPYLRQTGPERQVQRPGPH